MSSKKDLTIRKYIDKNKMSLAELHRQVQKHHPNVKYANVQYWQDNDWLVGTVNGKHSIYSPSFVYRMG